MNKNNFEKSIAKLRKTSISLLGYDNLFKLLANKNSVESYIDAGQVAQHWKRSSKKEPDVISKFIYYFPFCAQKCLYCREPSTKIKNKTEIDNFLIDTKKEMQFFSPIFNGRNFDYLTVNGGSPDLLSPNQLEAAMETLFSNFKFKDSAIRRIEVNPLGLNLKKLKIIQKFKFNRISFGVQSLSKKALQYAERPYVQFNVLKSIILSTRRAGFDDINIDLILGLPGESYLQFEDGLRKIFSLRPAQIMIYILNEPNKCYLKKYPKMKVVDFQRNIQDMLAGFIASDFIDEAEKSGYTMVPNKKDINYKYFLFVRNDVPSLSWLSDMDSYINIRTFVIGKRNLSNIPADLVYERVADFDPNVDIYKKFDINDEYEMKKFIFTSIGNAGRIDTVLFKKIFKRDIRDKFGSSIDILNENNRLSLINGVIVFINKDPKEVLIDVTFFILNMRK